MREFFEKYFSEEQILPAILFVVGMSLLTWLTNKERKELIKMRDPRLKWSYIDAKGKKQGEVKKMKMRSIVVTLVGGGLALYGFVSFLYYVP